MSQKLIPYPAYKKLGLAWIGRTPAHWGLVRLDRLFVLRSEAPIPEDERVTAYLNGRVTLRTNVQGQKIKGVVKEAGWQRIHPGDFAISGMNAHLGGMGVSDSVGKCSPIYLVLRPKAGTDADFISLVVRLIAQVGVLKTLVNTIRFNSADFKQEHLKAIVVWVPPPEEQQAIANFLAHFDQRINRLIRIKRRQIELLNEQKQAIIHRAVTRGLNPDVPLKPSGIDWLGDIPAHWQVARLKTLVTRFDQGISPQAESRLADSTSWGVVKAGCVNGGHFNEKQHKRLPADFDIPGNAVIRVGDVLVSRASGSPRLVGSVAKVRKLGFRLILSDKTFRLTFADKMSSDFFVTAMNSSYYRRQITQAISGAEGLANNLPLTALKNFTMLRPPSLEAVKISGCLECQLQPLNNLLVSHEATVNMCVSYRARLIADVVTGKLDVRNHPWSGAPLTDTESADELPTEDADLFEELAHAD